MLNFTDRYESQCLPIVCASSSTNRLAEVPAAQAVTRYPSPHRQNSTDADTMVTQSYEHSHSPEVTHPPFIRHILQATIGGQCVLIILAQVLGVIVICIDLVLPYVSYELRIGQLHR
jgi:hypothetical protein